MLSRQALQDMKARWQRDLAHFEAAFGSADVDKIADVSNSESEVVRNLATAIVHLGEMIATSATGAAPSSRNALDKERG